MIQVGILGGGGISETHARAVVETDGTQVAAVYGHNLEKAARLGQLYSCAVYQNVEAFFKHRPMDVVVIGSPSGLHAEQGIAAARHGLHVLVEKPIDVQLDRADALIAECERAGVKLGVFYQDRAQPDISRLKKLIDTGRLGKPILVSAQVCWYRPPEYYSESKWRGSPMLAGGGALISQGIHTVDLLLWLLGDVERVYAKAITTLHRIEPEDTLVATLEFANGAIGTLTAATSVYPGYPRRVEITGSEGSVVLEHDRLIAVDLRHPLKGFTPSAKQDANASASSPLISDARGHHRLVADFIRAIELNDTPSCDGHEGRRSLELVQAIYESSRVGQPVDLADVR